MLPGHVTELLLQMQRGEQTAGERLIALLYGELHALADHCMRAERPDHTLQPTILVHDAFLRLTEHREIEWQSRAHFLALAATTMRRILTDHARGRRRQKRYGGERITLDDAMAVSVDHTVDLLALDEALTRLAGMSERQARVVELRFFGGLEVEEAAEVLGVSSATVKRDWRVARAWLVRALELEGARP